MASDDPTAAATRARTDAPTRCLVVATSSDIVPSTRQARRRSSGRSARCVPAVCKSDARAGTRRAGGAPVEVVLRRVGRLLSLLAVAGSLPIRRALAIEGEPAPQDPWVP